MEISDHMDAISQNPKEHTVWKLAQQGSANVVADDTELARILADAKNDSIQIAVKLVCQVPLLGFVPIARFQNLGPSRRGESDRQH
jgi:hypothetical protein